MSLVIILGPTAVGKTKIAARLAVDINGEVVSADSRQVYKNLNIGAGKDLEEYNIGGLAIPYHLIDIRDIGDEYNVFQFQKDFYHAFEQISERKKEIILCGGTGLYLETAIAKQQLLEVPIDERFRDSITLKSDTELRNQLMALNNELHNTSDLLERSRTIRAIEIERYKKQHQVVQKPSPIKKYHIFGIRMDRSLLREQIKRRLDGRLELGMIEEVDSLFQAGITMEQLQWLGLEYKYIALHLKGDMDYSQMYEKLLQAIRRFAKKQMTWYRRMEKHGHKINWIDAEVPLDEKINLIKSGMKDE